MQGAPEAVPYSEAPCTRRTGHAQPALYPPAPPKMNQAEHYIGRKLHFCVAATLR
jgi:hypothetical protein